MTVLRHIVCFLIPHADISVSLLYNIPKGQLSATERPYSLGISTPCGDTNDFTPHSNQPPTSGLPLLILIYTNIFNHPIPGDILAEIARRNPTSEQAQPATMSASITAAQVKEHATPEKGLYIIIDNSVYSMADFADEHPGGSKILKRVGGKGMSTPQAWGSTDHRRLQCADERAKTKQMQVNSSGSITMKAC